MIFTLPKKIFFVFLFFSRLARQIVSSSSEIINLIFSVGKNINEKFEKLDFKFKKVIECIIKDYIGILVRADFL